MNFNESIDFFKKHRENLKELKDKVRSQLPHKKWDHIYIIHDNEKDSYYSYRWKESFWIKKYKINDIDIGAHSYQIIVYISPNNYDYIKPEDAFSSEEEAKEKLKELIKNKIKSNESSISIHRSNIEDLRKIQDRLWN